MVTETMGGGRGCTVIVLAMILAVSGCTTDTVTDDKTTFNLCGDGSRTVAAVGAVSNVRLWDVDSSERQFEDADFKLTQTISPRPVFEVELANMSSIGVAADLPKGTLLVDYRSALDENVSAAGLDLDIGHVAPSSGSGTSPSVSVNYFRHSNQLPLVSNALNLEWEIGSTTYRLDLLLEEQKIRDWSLFSDPKFEHKLFWVYGLSPGKLLNMSIARHKDNEEVTTHTMSISFEDKDGKGKSLTFDLNTGSQSVDVKSTHTIQCTDHCVIKETRSLGDSATVSSNYTATCDNLMNISIADEFTASHPNDYVNDCRPQMGALANQAWPKGGECQVASASALPIFAAKINADMAPITPPAEPYAEGTP